MSARTSWREFGALVKVTPSQFEREAQKPWQRLIDLAIDKMDHAALVDDTAEPCWLVFTDGSAALKHLAYLAAQQLLATTNKEERAVRLGGISTWPEFVAQHTSEDELQQMYTQYNVARVQMYTELDVLFKKHLSFPQRCHGPMHSDFRDEDDADWMSELVMDYHESGQSGEDKREEDYQAHAMDGDGQ